MKNHVPSLDLCKQLKEAGYPQERATYFRWLNFGDLIDGKDFRTLLSENFNSEDDTKEWYAAPLLTELLENLPSDYLARTPDEAARKWLDLHSAT